MNTNNQNTNKMEELKGQALVGKKVRVIKEYTVHNYSIGDIGEIISYDSELYCVLSNDYHQWLEIDDFQLIQDTLPKSIHQQILEAKGFKIGDTVRVTHKVPTDDLGWNNSWLNIMDDVVGKEFIIDKIYSDDKGISLSNNQFTFPAQSLEIVEVKSKTIPITGYEAVVYRDKVTVGCSSFPIYDIELILEIAKSL